MLSDWIAYFYPQIEHPWVLHVGIFNLPWLYVVLHPLVLFGPYPSAIIVQIGTLVALWYICNKLELPPVRRLLVFLSPPVLWGAFMGQFDGLLLLAYFAPAWIAPIAALVKPQVNIGAPRSLKPIWPYAIAALFGLLAFLVWKWPLAVRYPTVGGPLDTTSRGLM